MFRTVLATVMALAMAGPLYGASDSRKAEADLKAVQAEIERIGDQVRKDQVEKDRLTRALRDAETSAGDLRETLEQLKRDRSERAQRRAALAAQKAQRQQVLADERGALAGQLRAAYLIGREEPLKLLLNQKEPARAGRMFVYYSYFGRARAEQINSITENVARIESLEQQLDAEDRELAALEAQRKAQLARLNDARDERGKALAGLQTQSRSRVENLERLKKQKAGLERLVRDLRRAIESHPMIDGNDAFARLRGQLNWPVAGKVTARFGETRAGGVKWDGIMVSADRGASVRAISAGRVIYADWLPGLGLLAIVDHGEGYISLYGHNDRLFKSVGERVAAGDPLGAAGDSGGSARPEVYFEIRKGGRPVDPRPWFRSAQP